MAIKRYAMDLGLISKIKLKISSKLGLLKKLSDEEFLKKRYAVAFGKELQLECPQTFNEKLQWLKLHDRKPIYTTMVDKFEAKKYVSDIIGEKYIIPTFGVWDKFDDIDFDSLPNQFVLKCTHDSGGIVVCRDKSTLDFKKAKNKIEKSLKRNFYYVGREWPYKNVKPRIIAEKYLENGAKELVDYKFMCFGGKVECIFVCSERFEKGGAKITVLNRNWEKMPLKRLNHNTHFGKIDLPEKWREMIEVAEVLSKGFPFLRVDLYELNGSIFFGELTFYPASGFLPFDPEEWDLKFGNMLKLTDV